MLDYWRLRKLELGIAMLTPQPIIPSRSGTPDGNDLDRQAVHIDHYSLVWSTGPADAGLRAALTPDGALASMAS